MNPLIPQPSDILWSVAVVVNTILVIMALISLAKADDKRRWLLAVLLIVFLPIVGPLASLAETRGWRIAPVGRPKRDAAHTS